MKRKVLFFLEDCPRNRWKRPCMALAEKKRDIAEGEIVLSS